MTWPTDLKSLSYLFDANDISADFEKESERLFVSDNDVNIKIMELHGEDYIFENSEQLREYWEKPNTQTTRIILIPQPYSWGRLEISSSGMKTLLSNINIMPRVLDLLRAFGQKTNFRDESAGGYHEESSVSHDEDLGDKSCTELCYLVKHTELHGRSGSHDPWSMRQVGVYHKQELHISSNQQQDTFIILNPSETILHRLKAFKESVQQRGKDSAEIWIELHLLVLSSVTEKWKWYISYLEERFLGISQKPLLASVGENSTLGMSDFAIRFADTQKLQEIRDILLRISFMLEINHVVLSAIMRKASSQLPSPGENGRCNILRALEAETLLQQKRVETLLRRLDGSSTLIRNILDFRGLDALQTNSRTTTELSILAQDDNRMMTGLAYKSRRDAKTLKVLTILALIYLPASFVSTLLGMNYIHVDSSNPVKLHFAREMWIFAVLTVVLLVLTVAVWKLWERRYSADEDLESAGGGVGKHINLKKQE